MTAMMGSPADIFGRACVGDANIFFCARNEDIKAHYGKIAVGAKKAKGTLPRELLSASVQKRLAAWEEWLSQQKRKGSHHIMDLKHNASFHGQASADKTRCLLRGSIIWHHELQRGLIPQELLVMMGFPYPKASSSSSLPSSELQLACPFDAFFQQKSAIRPSQWIDMLGNGIHCTVAGAVLLWGLAHVAPPAQPSCASVPRALPLPASDEGEDIE